MDKELVIIKIPNNKKCETVEQLKEHCEKAIQHNDRVDEHQLTLSLINKVDNLNKGIDELLKKYENEITIYTESTTLIDKIITDLKKLKGE